MVERQDVVDRTTQLPFPNRFAAVDAKRNDAAISGRDVDTIGGEGRGGVRRRRHVAAPDQFAVDGPKRADLAGRGSGDQPAVVPHRWDRQRIRKRQLPRHRTVAAVQRLQRTRLDEEYEAAACGRRHHRAGTDYPLLRPGDELVGDETIVVDGEKSLRTFIGRRHGQRVVQRQAPHVVDRQQGRWCLVGSGRRSFRLAMWRGRGWLRQNLRGER